MSVLTRINKKDFILGWSTFKIMITRVMFDSPFLWPSSTQNFIAIKS